MVRLARKARVVASGDEAEAAARVATLAPEVRACLVSFDVRARSVSRIEVSPPNCDTLRQSDRLGVLQLEVEGEETASGKYAGSGSLEASSHQSRSSVGSKAIRLPQPQALVGFFLSALRN